MATIDRRGASVDASDAPSSKTPNANLAIKTAVRAATTGANIDLQTIGLGIIDGVQLNPGDRVLVKDQADQTTNGIYNASSGVWAMSSDFQNNNQLAQGCEVFVTGGTINGGVLYWLTTANPIVVGASLITFSVLQVARGLTNVRLGKTGPYTLGNADKGSTIALGGSAFFTLTVAAAGGYDSNFSALLFNEDTGRGKTIAISGIANVILWPLQAVLLFNDNGTWQIWPRAQRWVATPTLIVDPVNGNDSNDGLAAGVGGALLTPQMAASILLSQVDLGDGSGGIELANGTYSGSAAEITLASVSNNSLISMGGASGQGASVLWEVPAGQVGIFVKDLVGLELNNMTIGGGTGAELISVGQLGIVDIGAGVTFGNVPGGTHISVSDNGSSSAVGGYTISGTAYNSHLVLEEGGQFSFSGQTINVSGVATFTDFVLGLYSGTVNAGGASFTGAGAGSNSTGAKFNFNYGATLLTGGVDPNTIFPGATNGTVTIGAADGVTLANQLQPIFGGGLPSASVFVAKAVNFNAANSDTSLAVGPFPPGAWGYVVNNLRIANASASISTSTIGLNTAAGGGGTQIVADGTAITVTSGTLGSNNATMVMTPATTNTQPYGNTTLYVRVGNAEGSPATADVQVQVAWLY